MVATRRLPRLARYTWRRHWPAALLDGASTGLVALAPFAVKRSLGAPEEVVPLLIAVWQAFWIFAPALGPFLARSHPQRTWRRIALLAHAPLLLVALVAVRPPRPLDLPLFVGALLLYYGAGVAAVPHRGALLRTNYAPEVRGRMYARLAVLALVSTFAASKLGGFLLDGDPRWLRVLYPAAAVLGFLAYSLQSRIRWRGQGRIALVAAAAGSAWAAWRRAWRETFRILREDRAFRTYEIGFMLYGFGFLMAWPLLILYAEDELRLTYGEFTWAQGFAFPAAQMLGSALWGRLADRIGVVRTTGFAFVAVAAFLLSLQGVAGAAGFVLAYFLFGGAMAGVHLGWGLGPLHFAPDGQAHMYTAVHFSLVGVRSVLAPFLGYGIKEALSFRAGFAAALFAMLLAVLTMARLARAERVS